MNFYLIDTKWDIFLLPSKAQDMDWAWAKAEWPGYHNEKVQDYKYQVVCQLKLAELRICNNALTHFFQTRLGRQD